MSVAPLRWSSQTTTEPSKAGANGYSAAASDTVTAVADAGSNTLMTPWSSPAMSPSETAGCSWSPGPPHRYDFPPRVL